MRRSVLTITLTADHPETGEDLTPAIERALAEIASLCCPALVEALANEFRLDPALRDKAGIKGTTMANLKTEEAASRLH